MLSWYLVTLKPLLINLYSSKVTNMFRRDCVSTAWDMSVLGVVGLLLNGAVPSAALGWPSLIAVFFRTSIVWKDLVKFLRLDGQLIR